MGNQSQKKRDATRAAERMAKKRAAKPAEAPSALDAPDQTSDGVLVPAIKQLKSVSKPQAVAPEPPARRSTRSKHSSSTVPSTFSALQDMATHDDQSIPIPRPRRTIIASAKAQLLQAALDDESEPEENSENENDYNLTDDDLDHLVEKRHSESPGPDVDVGEIQLSLTGQLGLVAPRPVMSGVQKRYTKTSVMENDDDEDEESEPFEIKCECHDKAKGSRYDLVLLSSTPWPEVLRRVAQKFNVYDQSLQLQYIFSNEKLTALPFELNSEQAYKDMCAKYEQLMDPGLTSTGKPRKARKMIVVMLFDKNADGESGSKGKGKAKTLVNPAANVNAPLAKADELHEKRKRIAAEIAEEWTCLTHSQPDKPVLCWRTRSHEEILTGPCYPITVSNINMWTGLVVQDPDRFSVKSKPVQITVQLNGVRRQGGRPDPIQPVDMQFPGAPTQPMPMPYGFYPPPHMYFPHPMPQQGWPSMPPGFPPNQSGPNVPMKSIKGPAIRDWLNHCESLPDRRGPSFRALAEKFEEQGYRTIDQLTSSRIAVVDLSVWLEIGKGTADLIISYADEDMVLVRNGMFKMHSAPAASDDPQAFDWGLIDT